MSQLMFLRIECLSTSAWLMHDVGPSTSTLETKFTLYLEATFYRHNGSCMLCISVLVHVLIVTCFQSLTQCLTHGSVLNYL